MRICLDTNVLVSGLLSPNGAPAQVLLLVVYGLVQVCYDERILAEYEDVLGRPKFAFDAEQMGEVIERIHEAGIRVECKPLPMNLPDRDDEKFLEAAIAGDAMCLVTGNLKHFPVESRQGVNVLSPVEFIASLPD